jgi:hypothetical protein
VEVAITTRHVIGVSLNVGGNPLTGLDPQPRVVIPDVYGQGRAQAARLYPDVLLR